MTKEVKVSFYLKRNETKKDGKSPVMARLSIGKYSETIFINYMHKSKEYSEIKII